MGARSGEAYVSLAAAGLRGALELVGAMEEPRSADQIAGGGVASEPARSS